MQLILFEVFSFGKLRKNMEKRSFSRAATAGLGKYCLGSYGSIGVYRDMSCPASRPFGVSVPITVGKLSSTFLTQGCIPYI